MIRNERVSVSVHGQRSRAIGRTVDVLDFNSGMSACRLLFSRLILVSEAKSKYVLNQDAKRMCQTGSTSLEYH
ncbi:hypothetical protein [Neorhodopirellula lusitana]|uniref:hypothetical protein n=1 Tax=Neorhodopirellula lusitana TaxID=445327 RepID=UPI0024B65B0A|nr:hypothetical protein [Neorhodopirellula lusitana]